MKSVQLLLLCLVCGYTLAQSFEGTWTSNKRNFGGNTYICVDDDQLHGSYNGGAGIFSGLIRGNMVQGYWYEAGYAMPYGTFMLTLNGNSFSGSWSYSGLASNATSTVAWTGSRSNGVRPTDAQCLRPSVGLAATGFFQDGAAICVDGDERDENSRQPASFARFPRFGAVEGYSPDAGRALLLSNYFVRDANLLANYRPEGNNAVFGPCTGCNRYLNSTDINTDLIVIGAAINDATFCGYFWTGFYNQRVSDEPICYTRNSFNEPDAGACGRGFVQNTAGGQQAANYNLINRLLNDIQAAFDALPNNLPPVIIQQGTFVDDDDDGSVVVPNPVPSTITTATTITNTLTTITNTNPTTATNTITNTITNTGTTFTNTVYVDDNDSSSASVAVLSLALVGLVFLGLN